MKGLYMLRFPFKVPQTNKLLSLNSVIVLASIMYETIF